MESITGVLSRLHKQLRASQTPNGTWGYLGNHGRQDSIEATCLAILALRRRSDSEHARALRALEGVQNPDGSWPAFTSDRPNGCWVTALATFALVALNREAAGLAAAIRWLMDDEGREANWFYRWKFRTVDKSVQFDPTKYGWGWVPATASWVIPTAFSVIALRQIRTRGTNRTAAVTARIEMGVSMLRDRMCPGGGWNAGNGMAFGVPYFAYIDATAIALLALAGHDEDPGVRTSLAWLMNRLPGCPSPYSLAWGTLALAAHRDVSREVEKTLERATNELTALIERDTAAGDPCTVAVCALALDAVEGDNVFEVRV